jgi:membrane protein DedA with SNARE-associated domain
LLALFDPTSFVSSWGYLAVFILSVLQSCCVPTSSELTMGFAGVLASEGKLSLPGVIAAGVAGEVVGAYIAYFIGRTGGRTLVDRYGKYILLTHRDLDRAEGWYQRHSRWGVFGSRLIPVIRNFVAVPAGVAEVPLVRFGVLTFLGSLIWDSAWALIGYQLGSSWHSIVRGFSDAGYLLAGLAVLAIVVFLAHRYHSYRKGTAEASGATRQTEGNHFAAGAPPSATGRTPVAGPPPPPARTPAGQPSVVPEVAYPAAVEAGEGPAGSN